MTSLQTLRVSYEKVLKPLQDLDEELGLFFTPLSHLNSVMNSEETQKAYEAVYPSTFKVLLLKWHKMKPCLKK